MEPRNETLIDDFCSRQNKKPRVKRGFLLFKFEMFKQVLWQDFPQSCQGNLLLKAISGSVR